MCETKIYVEEDGSLKLIAEEVIYIRKNGDRIEAYRIDGDNVKIQGYEIKYIDFMTSKVVLTRLSSS